MTTVSPSTGTLITIPNKGTKVTVSSGVKVNVKTTQTPGSQGLDSLNGLTDSSQTFADFDDTNVTLSIASAVSTHTFTVGWTGTLGISRGGTGASTQQSAINALTDVSSATNEHVLTKDTATGDAIFKVATGVGAVTAINNAAENRITTIGAVTTELDGESFWEIDGTKLCPTGTGKSVFIGEDAGLVDDLSDNNNVFVGWQAGIANTSGENNVFVGSRTGESIVTAGGNVHIGSPTGTFSTGSNNVYIGSLAGVAAGSGVSNLYIGTSAGRFNSGSNNVFMGFQSGDASSSGSENVFLGAASGGKSTGSRNIYFGYHAGEEALAANNNTFIGYQAGNNLTTGGANLLVGYDIDAQSATASNQMSLGNLLFSEGIDGTGTDVSTGYLGVGVVDPDTRLHVEEQTATTDAADPVLRLTATSTGTSASGKGVSIEIETSTSTTGGNTEVVAVLDGIATDVTATAEIGAWVFRTMKAGVAATEDVRINAADGTLKVDQSVATGAKPVLHLVQQDVSEEMMELDGTTIGVGNAIEAVGAKTLTTTHFVKCTLTGVGARYLQLGTIA